eukprot:scaffold2503_cov301-Prasinococcus_capsulatus_cf.AAC.7
MLDVTLEVTVTSVLDGAPIQVPPPHSMAEAHFHQLQWQGTSFDPHLTVCLDDRCQLSTNVPSLAVTSACRGSWPRWDTVLSPREW